MLATLQTLHSIVRWVVLPDLLVALVLCAVALRSAGAWSPVHKITAIAGLAATDLQWVLGAILWAQSPMVLAARADMGTAMRDPVLRFFAVEHPTMMVLAVIAVHVGYAKAKRAVDGAAAHKAILIGYGLGLLLMVAAVPWPFRGLVGRPLLPW